MIRVAAPKRAFARIARYRPGSKSARRSTVISTARAAAVGAGLVTAGRIAAGPARRLVGEKLRPRADEEVGKDDLDEEGRRGETDEAPADGAAEPDEQARRDETDEASADGAAEQDEQPIASRASLRPASQPRPIPRPRRPSPPRPPARRR
jgi:hypothetical protein